jgi:hypothetical protein
MLKDDTNMAEWVQSKITLSADYISTVRDYMTSEMSEEVATDKQVKMAVGIANDKRYAGGNMTGAVKVMDKIKKGLANHPKVQGALKKANEQVEPIEELSTGKYNEYMKASKAQVDSHKQGKDDSRYRYSNAAGKMQDRESNTKKAQKFVAKKTVVGEELKHINELKSSTLTSYIDKVATGPSRGKTQSGLLKSIKAITGVTKAIRKRSENNMKEDTVNEVSKGMAHNYMVAAHKKFDTIRDKSDASSEAKKAKLIKGIKKASQRRNPKPAPSPEQKVDMSSPSAYYASKKPGEYTGD